MIHILSHYSNLPIPSRHRSLVNLRGLSTFLLPRAVGKRDSYLYTSAVARTTRQELGGSIRLKCLPESRCLRKEALLAQVGQRRQRQRRRYAPPAPTSKRDRPWGGPRSMCRSSLVSSVQRIFIQIAARGSRCPGAHCRTVGPAVEKS